MIEPEWWEYELRHRAKRERILAVVIVPLTILAILVAGAGLGAAFGISMR